MEKLAQLSPKPLPVAGLVTGTVLQPVISNLRAANDNDDPEPPPAAAAPVPRLGLSLRLDIPGIFCPAFQRPLLRSGWAGCRFTARMRLALP